MSGSLGATVSNDVLTGNLSLSSLTSYRLVREPISSMRVSDWVCVLREMTLTVFPV